MSVTANHQFGKLEQMQYRFMMELFDLKLSRVKFRKDFGVAIEHSLWKEMFFMFLAGAFDFKERDFIRLSPGSRYLLVVMMREFFSGVNNIRDQARQALAPSERLMCLINDKIVS